MYTRLAKSLPAVALLGLSIAGPLAAQGTQPGPEGNAGKGKRDTSVLFGLQENFPVVADGDRFISVPYGDTHGILDVVATVQQRGVRSRARIRDFRIADGVGTAERAVERFDYTVPEACGGHRFIYLAGRGFTALGFHYEHRIVLDVLSGGGGLTAPRLWGPNDQVLNDFVPMRLVAGDASKDGIGLLKASYVVGLLADLPKGELEEYGQAYAAAVRKAQGCR